MINIVPKIDFENNEGYILEKVLGEFEFKNIEFVYPSRLSSVFLNDFFLKVSSAKILTLIRRSGSGK